jgi:uncharacterized membrane protein
MANREVPISESLTFGWETFKANFLFLIGLFLVVFVMVWFVNAASEFEGVDTWFAKFIIDVIGTLVQLVLDMGVIVITLKFVAGERPEFADLFSRAGYVLHYLGASIIVVVMVSLGLVFLIVPGIYLWIRVGFFGFYIVDEGVGPLDALQKSWDLTRGAVMELFVFWLLVAVVNLVGALFLMVGLFASLPVTSLMTAYMFRRLQGPPPDVETQVAQAA